MISLNQSFSQIKNDEQKKLEAQRLKLKKEIKQINNLLFSNTKIRKIALNEVENIETRLNVRLELIKVTNQQANLLTRRININQRNIENQRKELDELKKEYAKMIQKSYASKSLQNRLMFLFSSENFLQAYRRIQYLKQYARYRRKQGLQISEKTKLLQNLNKGYFCLKLLLRLQQNKGIFFPTLKHPVIYYFQPPRKKFESLCYLNPLILFLIFNSPHK